MIHRESLKSGCPNRQLHAKVPILFQEVSESLALISPE